MSDPHTAPDAARLREPADDPHLADPTIDAPWTDLGPREDLSEEEIAERAARPDSHSGS